MRDSCETGAGTLAGLSSAHAWCAGEGEEGREGTDVEGRARRAREGKETQAEPSYLFTHRPTAAAIEERPRRRATVQTP